MDGGKTVHVLYYTVSEYDICKFNGINIPANHYANLILYSLLVHVFILFYANIYIKLEFYYNFDSIAYFQKNP